MKKQIQDISTKSVLMIALALCASAKSASAQSYKRITAKIPFNFTVGDKTPPAGAYTLRQPDVNTPYLLSLRGSSGNCERLYERDSNQQSCGPNESGLPKYGDRRFLSEILFEDDDTGRQFLKSHAERELTCEMARNSSRPEMAPIVVANQP